MRAIATCAVVMMLGAMAMAAAAGARSPATLTVRLYNTADIPAPELLAARRASESILSETGLAVIFRHCGRPVSPQDAIDRCDETLMPAEVVVRIIKAPQFTTTLHPEAYGIAYVVRETNRGWLATVFSGRIDHAASRVGVDPGTLLGRVMAHEVAHLLLGIDYHGVAGLMRADWTDAVLTRTPDQWRFSRLEAERIQRILESL